MLKRDTNNCNCFLNQTRLKLSKKHFKWILTPTSVPSLSCSPSSPRSTPWPPSTSCQTGMQASVEMDRQMDGKQEGGGKGWMEGRRRGRGVTHIAEPRVFIEESVLIGKPLGEQQHCIGTLLLVLHLLNLPFSLSSTFSYHLVLLTSFTYQNLSSLRLHRSFCCLPRQWPTPHLLTSTSYPSTSFESLRLYTALSSFSSSIFMLLVVFALSLPPETSHPGPPVLHLPLFTMAASPMPHLLPFSHQV